MLVASKQALSRILFLQGLPLKILVTFRVASPALQTNITDTNKIISFLLVRENQPTVFEKLKSLGGREDEDELQQQDKYLINVNNLMAR